MTTSARARASGHPVGVPAFAGTSGAAVRSLDERSEILGLSLSRKIVPASRSAHAGYSWRTRMAKVAFVGLGVMGYPMAGHLKAKGGHEVTVYNRTAAKAEKWVAQHGGKSAPTPKA